MAVTTITSREFNQDTSGAKKAAAEGPVFITDRGRPAHVLLTIQDYQRLAGGHMTLLEALAQSGEEADFDFELPVSAVGSSSRPISSDVSARHQCRVGTQAP